MSSAEVEPVPYDPLSYLRANAAARGGEAAVYDDGEELTFDALLRAVLSLAADLQARGVEAGDVVAVALPNVWRYVALEIAVPATGATLLPLPTSLGRLEAASAIERSGASLVIANGSGVTTEVARDQASVRAVLEPEELDAAGDADHAPPAPADPDRVVQIALTSGTTGRSKLASLTAELKQLTFEGFTTRLGFGPGDRMLPLSPITQGAGEMCLYALRTGAALVMAHHARFDAERSLELAERSRATVLGGVPTMIARMLHAPALEGTDLRHVRATISAGAPLPPTVAREWEERTGSPTCSFYGAMDLGQLAVPSPDDPAEKRWSTVGRPHDRAEVMICDPDGNALERGEEGEICMRGPLVQPRYWPASPKPRTRRTAGRTSATSGSSTPRATCTSPAASRTRSSAAAATSTRSRSKTCCAPARRSRTSASSATPTRTSASGRARSWWRRRATSRRSRTSPRTSTRPGSRATSGPRACTCSTRCRSAARARWIGRV